MIKAYSKKEAYAAVRALRDGKPEECDLNRLLHFFAPVRTRKVKSAEEWVALACGVRDVRAPLNYVYVSEGVAWGSDSYRAHWAATSLPEGYYCPRTLDPVPSDRIGPYPDIKRAVSWATDDLPETPEGMHSVANPSLPTIEYGGTHINARYVADAAPVTSSLRIAKGIGAAGTSKWGQFAIMAIRV